MSQGKKFNIRVYGILTWNEAVLVSDEYLIQQSVTKFPGGGLEWGEGLTDCLKREFSEELSIEIHNETLFYINDFFQLSAYHPDHQVISIYYLVQTQFPGKIRVKNTPHEHDKPAHGSQVFRWIPKSAITPDDFCFPIDKIVAKKLAL